MAGALNLTTAAEAGVCYREEAAEEAALPRVLYQDGSDIRRGNDWSTTAVTELQTHGTCNAANPGEAHANSD